MTNELTLEIENYFLEDEYYEYDGNTHSVQIKGDLPESYKVVYENNSHKNIGEYQVIANIFDGDSIDMYSTSFATPVVLANELKQQKQK